MKDCFPTKESKNAYFQVIYEYILNKNNFFYIHSKLQLKFLHNLNHHILCSKHQRHIHSHHNKFKRVNSRKYSFIEKMCFIMCSFKKLLGSTPETDTPLNTNATLEYSSSSTQTSAQSNMPNSSMSNCSTPPNSSTPVRLTHSTNSTDLSIILWQNEYL